jgi:hypothetical protein
MVADGFDQFRRRNSRREHDHAEKLPGARADDNRESPRPAAESIAAPAGRLPVA